MTTLILDKPKERYVFRFDDESRADMLRELGRMASNPLLGLTWYDCAKLSQVVRRSNPRMTTWITCK